MERKKDFKKKLKEWVNIILGVALASFSFSFFLNPNDIVIGGVSGVGILLKNLISGYDPAITILILNALLLILGLILLGKDFFLKTAFGSLLFPLFIGFFDFIYEILKADTTTLDMVLIALFAALIMGVGLGIVVRNGGTTGGRKCCRKSFSAFPHPLLRVALHPRRSHHQHRPHSQSHGSPDLPFTDRLHLSERRGMDTVIFAGFNKRAVCIVSDKHEIKEIILKNFERA